MTGTSKNPQFKIRIPGDVLTWLKKEAEKSRRSVTAEIVHRLEQSQTQQQTKEARQ